MFYLLIILCQWYSIIIAENNMDFYPSVLFYRRVFIFTKQGGQNTKKFLISEEINFIRIQGTPWWFMRWKVFFFLIIRFGCAFWHPLSKWVKGVFIMPRLSKKAKQEWKFFIAPNTGRRTYNKLCRKCHSDCKQSYRVIIVYCRKFKAKRSVITKDDK